jgi:hypothetical protein
VPLSALPLSRNPNNANTRAAIATANAPQPSTDRSCLLMGPILGADRRAPAGTEDTAA